MLHRHIEQVRQHRDDGESGRSGSPHSDTRILHVGKRLLGMFHCGVNREGWQGPKG